MQQELKILGVTTRSLYLHPASEIKACQTISHAIFIALRHAGMTQDIVAERISISPSYMSLLMTRKRKWSEDKLRMLCLVTGSMAPEQWRQMQLGCLVYVDEAEARRAQLRAELKALEDAA